MSILIVALPVALLVVAAAVAAFVWAVRSGQYDDLETPAVRLLHDEKRASELEGARDRNGAEPEGPAAENGHTDRGGGLGATRDAR